jgi:enoyl-CoA hydratase
MMAGAVPEAEVIRFERRGRLGVVILDRQRALNALTQGMVRALSLQLVAWREDPAVGAVLVKAAPGRAFCAGGDIRAICKFREEQRIEDAVQFYREEYRLNWRIFRYPKPYIALIDGIVMGGGVGISVHGSHRVVSENVSFAMPETGIGFFPDVGGTWFLPRCPGEIGTWLALTGSRLELADTLLAGIGTRHVPAERMAALEEALTELPPGAAAADVDEVLAGYAKPAGEARLAALRPAIDRCFAGDSLAAIEAALERDGGEFGAEALAAMRQRSPLSLQITLAQLRKGAALTFEEAMALELRLATRFMRGHDFFEGVRALLIDKDKQPRWAYPDTGSVPQEVVDACFAPLGEGELTFDWVGL